MARDIKNNNPGNIRKSTDHWQGLAETQNDPDFFQFESMERGVQAMAKILLKYQDTYKINTITKIIQRWAPPTENNTKNYIAVVSSRTEFNASEPLNLHDFTTLKAIMKAMIFEESGGVAISENNLERGIVLAGIIPPKKSLVRSKSLLGAVSIAIGTTANKALELSTPINQARDSLAPLTDTDCIKWIFIGLTFIGLFLVIFSCLVDHKKRLT